MRDPNRIEPFMKELGQMWKENCPDWRFGQLMFNATRVLKTCGTDIFYMEDDELLAYFEEWFDIKEHNRKIHRYISGEEKMFERDILGVAIETKNYKEEK